MAPTFSGIWTLSTTYQLKKVSWTPSGKTFLICACLDSYVSGINLSSEVLDSYVSGINLSSEVLDSYVSGINLSSEVILIMSHLLFAI